MTTQTQTLTTILKHKITVFKNDHIGDKIEKNGLYEKENLSVLNQIISKIHQPIVLDVGANIGNHSLAFSTVAKDVYAFEPLPLVYSLLTKNIEQNKISNIHPLNFALSDNTEDSEIFMIKEGNVGASSFDKREDNVEPIVVKKQIGDNFLQENNINKIDFIKIDVEAHEVFVLKGLEKTLKRHKPIITMEWNDPLTIKRLNGSAILEYLISNYNIYVLGSNFDRRYWKGLPFAFIRRKLTRLFKTREAALYKFSPSNLYKNLLLIPKGKEDLIKNIQSRI